LDVVCLLLVCVFGVSIVAMCFVGIVFLCLRLYAACFVCFGLVIVVCCAALGLVVVYFSLFVCGLISCLLVWLLVFRFVLLNSRFVGFVSFVCFVFVSGFLWCIL